MPSPISSTGSYGGDLRLNTATVDPPSITLGTVGQVFDGSGNSSTTSFSIESAYGLNYTDPLATPEPATWALLGLGAGALGLLRRRRRAGDGPALQTKAEATRRPRSVVTA